MLCCKCDRPLPSGAEYCIYCGAKQVLSGVCPRCGSKLLDGAFFCMKCGTDVRSSDKRQTYNSEEPFYKKWIAAHKQLAEAKHITWISEFSDGYAVAIDDNAPGKELRPFLVKGEDRAELICYMNWTGANVANGVLQPEGDCFRNGTRYLSFILFRSKSVLGPEEFRHILKAFTGLTMPFSTSGITVLISRDSRIVFAAQYQENITGIADIFPLRVIGSKYCLHTHPEDYNRMTNHVRYMAGSDEINTSPQRIVDCDSGACILDNVFVPKYEGDPSGYFVEFFFYNKDIASLLRSRPEMDRQRCILNRKTGKIYLPENSFRFKPIAASGDKSRTGYFLLRISGITTGTGARSRSEYGNIELIDENDRVVTDLGKNDLRYIPEIAAIGGKIFVSIRSHSASGDTAEIATDVYCIEKTADGEYVSSGHISLSSDAGFSDGLVFNHAQDKTEQLNSVFSVNGKTYIALLQERDDYSEEYDKCLLYDEGFNEICTFGYKQHYGDQMPYGIHIFDGVLYLLTSEEDELGDVKAVLKNVSTGETVLTAEPAQLISGANAEFGKNRIRTKYEFGSYRAGGTIHFLVGKQGRGTGIIDFRGKTVIPADRENCFIVSSSALGMIGEGQSYARLPADTFLVVLGSFDSDRYKVCDINGTALFEGNMKALAEHFA